MQSTVRAVHLTTGRQQGGEREGNAVVGLRWLGRGQRNPTRTAAVIPCEHAGHG